MSKQVSSLESGVSGRPPGPETDPDVSPARQTLHGMLDELSALETAAQVLENQIFHVHIKLEDWYRAHAVGAAAAWELEEKDTQEKEELPRVRPPSVREMVVSVLPEMPDQFTCSELRDKCLATFPNYWHKIPRGIYWATGALIITGELVRSPDRRLGRPGK